MNTTPPLAPPAPIASRPEPPQIPHAPSQFSYGRALRAVILKEIRHNLVFVALSFLVVAIVLLVGTNIAEFKMRSTMNILMDSSAQAVALAAGMAGLLLGLLQPLPDQKFDLWSFSVHRPVPRTLLFYGRVLAGLLMHFATAGVPLLALFAFAMTRWGGDFFIWPFCLPCIAAYLVGIPFYFAALLASAGLKTFRLWTLTPLVLATGSAAITFISPWFTLAMLGSLAISALLFLAARRSTITHGYQLSSDHPPIAAPLVMLLSISFILFAGAVSLRKDVRRSWMQQVVEPRQREPQPLINTSYPIPWFSSYLTIMPDGTPARHTYIGFTQRGHDQELEDYYTDLHGNGLMPPPESDPSADAGRRYVLRPTSGLETPTYDYLNLYNLIYTNSHPLDSYHVLNYYGIKSRGVFYVYDEYSPHPWLNNDHVMTYVGVMGANGLVKNAADATPFDGALNLPIMQTSHKLLHLNPDGLSFTTLLETQGDETIRSWGGDEKKAGDHESTDDDAYYVFTTKRFLLISRLTGHVFVSFPIPHIGSESYINLTPYPQANHPVQATSWLIATTNMSKDPWLWSRRYEKRDAQGKLLPDSVVEAPVSFSNYGITLAGPQSPDAKTQRKINRYQFRDGAWAACANPLFLAGCDLARGFFHSEDDDPLANPPQDLTKWDYQLPRNPRSLLTMAIVLAASGIAAFFAAWFYGASRIVWTLAALLCGPAALLALASTHKIPRYVKCQHCGKPRLRENEACSACKTDWPAPPHTGTEIFS